MTARSTDEIWDFIVVGSGFGGSVSALRLAEKGYRVLVLEAGKRWRAEDFPTTNWNLRKFLWLPALGCHGIQRLTLLKDMLVLSGAGVGGGSLVYANTLLAPPAEAFRRGGWRDRFDWPAALAPHYETAERILGVVEAPRIWEGDEHLLAFARHLGREETFHRTRVGVLFGERPGEAVGDPFFDGQGPPRSTCVYCGGCMVGCRHGAKNTLDKNYLWFAERLGAEVRAETLVERIEALGEAGRDGYRIHTRRSTRRVRRRREILRARAVVLAAGALGTVDLLLRSKEEGLLPALSPALGSYVRTNSEVIGGSVARGDDVDYSRGIAIASGFFAAPDTYMEVVRYPAGSDAMGFLGTLLTGGGNRVTRPLKWLRNCVRHPRRFLRSLWPRDWARRATILLVMQSLDNSLRLVRRPPLFPFRRRLTSERDPDRPPIPTYLPVAEQGARFIAKASGGVPMSAINEVVLNVPTTAHLLGGAAMGATPESGVVDWRNRVFGYENLWVIDGSAIPSNLGVNPSLTITALAEHAMSHVPMKPGAGIQHLPRAMQSSPVRPPPAHRRPPRSHTEPGGGRTGLRCPPMKLMKIPSLLLRQLYTLGSLENTDDGVRFSLKNRLSDGTLVGLEAVRIDGREMPLEAVRLELGDGQSVPAREVGAKHPIAFPLRRVVTFHVSDVGPLPHGDHDLEIACRAQPFGALVIKVKDAISEERGRRVAVPLDKENNYSREIVRRRLDFVAATTGVKIEHLDKNSFDPQITAGNIENFTGVAQVPIGFAGPLLVNGEHAKGEFLIPLATTEGTLVASYNRGIKVLNLSGGVVSTVIDDCMQRAPVFVFDSAREARDFAAWVAKREFFEAIRREAEATSSVAKLLYIDTYLAAKFAYLRFNFSTGDAAGQNMVGRATFAACSWMLEQAWPKEHVRRFYLESNLATDKKASQVNVMRTRGKRVVAECTVPRDVLVENMRVEPESLHYHAQVANVGTMLSGANNNGAHSPNGITAMFIATGQDVANVAESSAGITYTEITPAGDLYISITIPSLIVASHGGGTALPTQRECLQILDCQGKGKVRKLAEIIAGVALAGEISLAAAISSLDWVSSHEKYGRNR